ncbi:MAG TPA: hypothetical protein VME63_08385 [Dyella sp.]|uniref:hypothetical protein n=1 Tax=Dyella sp. TaxID=1869338 RepID=UPI002B667F91|nr:hypothetical protein [Dyella sp.]HTV85409.1 hypothetical protein [Dyella sp.]
MAVKFNPVLIEELRNACAPDKAQPSTYYRQGKDIVLVALNATDQREGLNRSYIYFTGERVEHRRDPVPALMIPLDKLEPRFDIVGTTMPVEFRPGSILDQYQEAALVLVEDQVNLLLKDFPDDPARDADRWRSRLMLNLMTRQVVRLTQGKTLTVFSHVIMSGHLLRHGKEESEKMAELKLRTDDRNQ